MLLFLLLLFLFINIFLVYLILQYLAITFAILHFPSFILVWINLGKSSSDSLIFTHVFELCLLVESNFLEICSRFFLKEFFVFLINVDLNSRFRIIKIVFSLAIRPFSIFLRRIFILWSSVWFQSNSFIIRASITLIA